MIKLQRRTDLAILALRQLQAAPDSRLTGNELANAIETTLSFLPQVMSPLVRAGWVDSNRGPGGGYSLKDASQSASLLDVIEATEGPAVEGRCILRDAPCPGDHSCPVHVVAGEARDVLLAGLGQIPAIPDNQGEEQ